MKRRWLALVGWMTAEEGAAPMALFRISVGAILLWNLLSMVSSGAMTLLWLPEASGGLREPPVDGLLASLVGVSAVATRALMAASIVASAMMMIGVATRLAALVLLVCFSHFLTLFPAAVGGHDHLLTGACFLLMLSRSDVTLSVRCRWAHGCWTSPEKIPGWPRKILVYQLVIMYVSTGIQKVGISWWPMGDLLAVHNVLLLPQWSRADWSWIAWLSPLTQLGTAVTVVWESSWWAVLWWMWLRKTADRGGYLRLWAGRVNIRRVYVLIGVLIHTTLWIMMTVGPFSPITMAHYFCLFAEEELPGAVTTRA